MLQSTPQTNAEAQNGSCKVWGPGIRDEGVRGLLGLGFMV